MPKRKTRAKRKSRKKKKGIKRPYKLDKESRARHRFKKRRHPASTVHGHHKRMRDESELSNYLLHQILKTAASTDADPYNYEPRHHTRDPEYRWETRPRQRFKRGFPAPDVSMLRPQHKSLPPHWGNYPLGGVQHRRPDWEHHPHVGIV